jgi:hypothetical protein
VIAVLALALLAALCSATLTAAEEVVIKGALVCDAMNGEHARHVRVLIAVDGSPAIAAVVAGVMHDCYPERGLDAAAAVKLQERFIANLRFYLDPDSPAKPPAGQENPGPSHYCHCAFPYAITGTITEHDGAKWIRATRYEALGGRLQYPAVMMKPDVPVAMPDGPPLLVKITSSLTLRCIKIPPGSCLMGEHIFVASRYLEQTPRVCTLTKPYFLSEIPITQEIWEAVMGDNPSKQRNPALPVQDAPFPAIEKFCATLSSRIGHKVRLPTGAEWEYAARVGTSNPGFPERYKDQAQLRGEGKDPLPARSKKPNAWGIYDLFSPWWELTSDAERYPSWAAEVDPAYPAKPGGKHLLLGVIGDGWTISEREFESNSGYTSTKFRIAIDADAATP